jgi:hypothetical protein
MNSRYVLSQIYIVVSLFSLPEEETTEKAHISNHQCLMRSCVRTHKSMKFWYSVLSLISNRGGGRRTIRCGGCVLYHVWWGRFANLNKMLWGHGMAFPPGTTYYQFPLMWMCPVRWDETARQSITLAQMLPPWDDGVSSKFLNLIKLVTNSTGSGGCSLSFEFILCIVIRSAVSWFLENNIGLIMKSPQLSFYFCKIWWYYLCSSCS